MEGRLADAREKVADRMTGTKAWSQNLLRNPSLKNAEGQIFVAGTFGVPERAGLTVVLCCPAPKKAEDAIVYGACLLLSAEERDQRQHCCGDGGGKSDCTQDVGREFAGDWLTGVVAIRLLDLPDARSSRRGPRGCVR